MKARLLMVIALLLILLVTGVAQGRAARPLEAAGSDAGGAVLFIENAGQWNAAARFQVWGGPDGSLWLAEDGLWLIVAAPGDDAESRRTAAVRVSFAGANPRPRLEPFDRSDTVISYFRGDDPDQWRPDVPVWRGVRYVNLYPGVDLVVGQRDGRLSLWLDARPGATLDSIALRVEGADTARVDDGFLYIETAAGAAALPLITAATATTRAQPAARPTGDGAFEVAAPFAAEIAQPRAVEDFPAGLLYGSYLGGAGTDSGYDIAVGGAGSAFITGDTNSADFPTTPGAFDTSLGEAANAAWVAKLKPDGSGLVYATFLAGNGSASGQAIVVDGAGNAIVAGQVFGDGFPTTPGAFDRTPNGGFDAFVTKLNATGSALIYSSYLGGEGEDVALGIALDAAGNATLTGYTESSNFPTTTGAFDTDYNDNSDIFVTRINPTGSALVYSTFVGGSWYERGLALAVDTSGNAYVTGMAGSMDFPTTPGAFSRSTTDYSAFVFKLNPTGSALVYSTYLGGDAPDRGNGIIVDATGSAWVAGETGGNYSDNNFPVTPGAFDTTYNGGQDGFLTRLKPDGSGLLYSTFLGGEQDDAGLDIVSDGAGGVYVVGTTKSGDFPTTAGGFDTSHNGKLDTFVIRFNPTGGGLLYGSFLGGSEDDEFASVATDAAGNVYVSGITSSSNFPTTPNAFSTRLNRSGYDAFAIKLYPIRITATTPVISSLDPPSATANQGDLTLTVNGLNFVDGSVVRWNGAERPTTFVSETVLQVAIDAADLAAVATVTVTVANPQDGDTSNPAAFAVTPNRVFMPVGVNVPPQPIPGYWLGTEGWVEFYVSPNSRIMHRLAFHLYVPECGELVINYGANAEIVNMGLSYQGSGLYGHIIFNTVYWASGTFNLSNYYVNFNGCQGYLSTKEPIPWDALWWNSSQPTRAAIRTGAPTLLHFEPAEGWPMH